jgi:HD-like signal output (HDOD) protein/prolyl-tRNA editing enzyme YbaK/EbsC (Cys-tRNA(Pro) deacylase)
MASTQETVLGSGSLSLPDAVRQILEARHVKYDLQHLLQGREACGIEQHFRGLRAAGAAQTVMFRDIHGVVQVIIPSDCLLDLQQLNTQLQRDLQALPPHEIMHLQEQYQVSSLPAVPQAMAGVMTVADQRLLEHESVLLDSGTASVLVRVERDLLQQIGGAQMRFGRFTVQLKDIASDASLSDEERFGRAVERFTGKRMQTRIAETLELPPLSETAQRIIKLLTDKDAGIEKLADIVESDPSLAAQVMSWARSPYYSSGKSINSVNDAITKVLGFDLVLNLALGLSLSRTLQLPDDGVNGSLPYWYQAIYVAAIMEGLARAVPARHRPNIGIAYLCGLLHNFGYLLLAAVFPPHFQTVCRYMEANPHLGHREIEDFLLQVNREQMASTLLSQWNMPEAICSALRHQQDPLYAGEYANYANLLHVATRLLREREFCDVPLESVTPAMYERLYLQPERAIAVVDGMLGAVDELEKMAGQMRK